MKSVRRGITSCRVELIDRRKELAYDMAGGIKRTEIGDKVKHQLCQLWRMRMTLTTSSRSDFDRPPLCQLITQEARTAIALVPQCPSIQLSSGSECAGVYAIHVIPIQSTTSDDSLGPDPTPPSCSGWSDPPTPPSRRSARSRSGTNTSPPGRHAHRRGRLPPDTA